MRIRPAHAIDFYKADHRRQYPAGTEFVYSNLTPRSCRLAPVLDTHDGKVVVLGLQGILKDFFIETWNENFFLKSRHIVVTEYKQLVDDALGVDAVPVEHIGALHDLGYLPLLIKALPEGSRIKTKIPFLTIRNTHPDFFWLVNYVETVLSSEGWKTPTAATIAYEFNRMLRAFAKLTGADPAFVPVQGHDFSFRGMSGLHDAARTGLGHLSSFIGTDTAPAIDYARDYYAAEGVIGISVPATEHSVMCMGTKEGEIETFRRLICDLYPAGIVSIVSDTWDFWKVVTEYTVHLKDEILARKPNALGLAKVVLRPDSGDPVKIICGDPDAPAGSPQRKGAVECLWDVFGGTTTDQGYQVLHERIGLIYGDSITLQRAYAILVGLAAKGFASSNIVFGIGSFTYQMISRDSFGTAMKATWGVVNGEKRAIFKDPITDDGQKKSAKGLLRVEKVGGDFVLHDDQPVWQEERGELRTVFKDSRMVGPEETLDGIRDRIAASLAEDDFKDILDKALGDIVRTLTVL
jgi:nicotinamide phosphoribosyltransferase